MIPTSKPLTPEERTRLAELCLALLQKYPRQAQRVGAVAVLWTGFRSAVASAERPPRPRYDVGTPGHQQSQQFQQPRSQRLPKSFQKTTKRVPKSIKKPSKKHPKTLPDPTPEK